MYRHGTAREKIKGKADLARVPVVYSYMRTMTKEARVERARYIALKVELADLKAYLQSAKFHEDPTVQVRDVLTRIVAAECRAIEAGLDLLEG
jgi:rubrerythrin